MESETNSSYVFRKESLVEVRQRLGLSQSQMANRLQVPKNTLWRWETGTTAPDANRLAAIYSLAMENDYMPTFFAPIRQKAKVRDRVLVFLDGLSVAPMFDNGVQASRWIVDVASDLVPEVNILRLKAYLNPSQRHLTLQFEAEGWRVWEDEGDWYEYIFSQALADSGQEPDATVVLLITLDPDYADLIRELHKNRVQVYVIAPAQPFGSDGRIGEAAREGHVITPPFHLLSEKPRLLYDRSKLSR